MSERGRWLQAGGHFSWVPNEPLLHADSLNIFHAEFGDPDAPLLLMVHGFPTSSIDWCDVAGELSVTHRVCESQATTTDRVIFPVNRYGLWSRSYYRASSSRFRVVEFERRFSLVDGQNRLNASVKKCASRNAHRPHYHRRLHRDHAPQSAGRYSRCR